MSLFESHEYDDIINLPHHKSQKHPHMDLYDRAAQFSPFAALTGFDAAIAETGRLTDRRIELDEGGKALLDEQMKAILDCIETQPEVQLVWFRYDERKAGGTYVTTTGNVKKIDTYTQRLLLTDGRTIPLGEIFSVVLI